MNEHAHSQIFTWGLGVKTRVFMLAQQTSFLKNQQFCLLFYVYERFESMCVSAPCVCTTCRGQRRVSDSLELKLQVDFSYHAGAENWTWDFCKSSQCSQLLSHFSSFEASTLTYRAITLAPDLYFLIMSYSLLYNCLRPLEKSLSIFCKKNWPCQGNREFLFSSSENKILEGSKLTKERKKSSIVWVFLNWQRN